MAEFEPDEDEQSAGPDWLAIIVGVLLWAVTLFFMFRGQTRPLTAISILSVYLLISHTITPPEPDRTDMGWLGGLLDNPFRLSDDYNRTLVLLRGLLLPGKLMTYVLVVACEAGWYYWQRRRK